MLHGQTQLKTQKALCLQRKTQEKFSVSPLGPEKGLRHTTVKVKHDPIPGGALHLKLSCAPLAMLLGRGLEPPQHNPEIHPTLATKAMSPPRVSG